MPNPRGNAGPLNPWLKREWQKAFPYGEQPPAQPAQAPPSPWQGGPTADPWSGSAATGAWSPVRPSPPIDVPMEVMPKAKPSPWAEPWENVGPNRPMGSTRSFRETDAGLTAARRRQIAEKLLPSIQKTKNNPALTVEDALRYISESGRTDAELEQMLAELNARGAGGESGDGTSGGSGATGRKYQSVYDSRGTDPNWIAAFEKKHKGNDPITQYTGGREDVSASDASSALWEADWDRRWAEDFREKHGVPPSDAAWQDSYWQRQRMKENGASPQAPY